MGLVFCPECDKKVSQYVETCPDCGFSIKKFMDDNNITDITKAFICPKCADIYFGYEKENKPLNVKCKYCSSIMVETNENADELFKLRVYKATKDQFETRSIQLAKEYGNNQFSQEEYEKRLIVTKDIIAENKRQRELKKQQSQSVPKCPKCGSTEIQVLPRMLGISKIFASNRVDRVCVNCKYRW